MKNFQPETVVIQLTTQCDFRCDHCMFTCGPAGGQVLDAQTFMACIRGALQAGAGAVSFSGGEPFLHPELLLSGIRYAHDLGLEVQAVTNSGWASTPLHRDRIVAQLARAGLTSLAISYDIFHQPFVDRHTIADLIHRLKEVKIQPIISCVLSACPGNVEVLRFIAGLETPVMFSLLHQMGRAKQLPASYFKLSPKHLEVCRRVNSPIILVDGTLTICCGFSDIAGEGVSIPPAAILGNVHDRDIYSILCETALPLRTVLANYSLNTLFAMSGAVGQGVCLEDFHHPCEICRFLLGNPMFIDCLTSLSRGEVLPITASDGRPGQVDAERWRRLVGKRAGIRTEAELIPDVNIYGWRDQFAGAKGVFDILCLYDADGCIQYNLLGKSLRQALLPSMSGETCILEDPSDVREGDVNQRIEESLRRCLLLRLADMNILRCS
jgi:pyruvate-formate lyase-activating enzyme